MTGSEGNRLEDNPTSGQGGANTTEAPEGVEARKRARARIWFACLCGAALLMYVSFMLKVGVFGT